MWQCSWAFKCFNAHVINNLQGLPRSIWGQIFIIQFLKTFFLENKEEEKTLCCSKALPEQP